MDMALDPNLSNVERQRKIVAEVDRRARITVAQVCDLFQISEATARRDLEQLAGQGKLQRVHGGALTLQIGQSAPPELPLADRSTEHGEEKRRIGAAAAALIQEGESIFISSGSTTLEVARGLRGRKNLTVITNSLLVINVLAGENGITLVGLGGVLRKSEQSFIGHIAEQSLNELRADKVILGVRAIHLEQGLTNDYLEETRTDRAILKIGREVILVADHSKLGRVSTAFVAPLTAVQRLVTDSGAQLDFVRALEASGILVTVV